MKSFARRLEAIVGPTDSPGHARQWLRTTLDARGIEPEMVDDACLVVSELVTNALIHGDGVGAVRVTIDVDAVHLAVTDFTESVPHARALGAADETGGLGLAIIGELSAQWGIDPFPGGKTVWADLTSGSVHRA